MNVIINKKIYKIVSLKELFNFKYNDECLLLKNINYFNTFLISNIDVLFIDDRNSVILKYLNMPKFKILKVDTQKEKTSILLLPKNASFGVHIGDILIFE